MASVVSSSDAIDEAFCSALRTTLVGSMTPAATRSSYLSFRALNPKLPWPSRDHGRGQPFHFGIEAGSKPELLAALAMHKDPESLIICNGYKDPLFIRIALLGRKLGKTVIIVVEKLEELEQIIAVSKRSRRRAVIGIRVRLLAKGAGQMGDERRREREVRPRHDQSRRCESDAEGGRPGALPETRSFPRRIAGAGHSARSSARCAKRRAFTRSSASWATSSAISMSAAGSAWITTARAATSTARRIIRSRNMRNDVVWNIMDVAIPKASRIRRSSAKAAAPLSRIIRCSWSKRSARSKRTARQLKVEAERKRSQARARHSRHETASRKQNRIESLHDAQQIKEEAQQMFDLGLLDLEAKAKIETRLLADRAADREHASRAALCAGGSEGTGDGAGRSIHLQLLRVPIAARSLGARAAFPDHADPSAHDAPDRNGTIVDITCDSDGKVSKFIDLAGREGHAAAASLVSRAKPYYIGFFLVGAYQDIMGDLHNLFGRVNEVHVFLDDDEEDGWYIEEAIDGSTIGEVLCHDAMGQTN